MQAPFGTYTETGTPEQFGEFLAYGTPAGALETSGITLGGLGLKFAKKAPKIAETLKAAPEVLEPISDYKKFVKNAYLVATKQKNEAQIARIKSVFGLPIDTPEKVILKTETFDEILKKHPDITSLNFNKALSFVKTLNFPETIKNLPDKQRINFMRNTANEFLNIVGIKPVIAKGETYINTSFLTNKWREINRFLKGGRPIPPSPIGVGDQLPTSKESIESIIAPVVNNKQQLDDFLSGKIRDIMPIRQYETLGKKAIGEVFPKIEKEAGALARLKFIGVKNDRIVETNQLANTIEKILPNKQDREALGTSTREEKLGPNQLFFLGEPILKNPTKGEERVAFDIPKGSEHWVFSVNQKSQEVEERDLFGNEYLDRVAAFIKGKDNQDYLLLDPVYMNTRFPYRRYSSEIQAACLRLGVEPVVIDKTEADVPYGLNLVQFNDKTVIMSAGHESLRQLLEQIVGEGKVFTTQNPVINYPVIRRGGIRCLTLAAPKGFLI